MSLEPEVLGDGATARRQKDGQSEIGGNHGAVKENVTPDNHSMIAGEKIMVIHLVMVRGVGMRGEIQNVQSHQVKTTLNSTLKTKS